MNRFTSKLPFSDHNGRISFRTMFSYIFDYVIIVVLAIAYAALDKLVQPFAQRFSLDDITIQYPYAVKERIPIFDAVLISGAFPLVVIAIYTLAIDGIFSHSAKKGTKRYTFKERLWELNCGVLGLFLAQGAAFCITGTLKNLIGRPRPDLIDRCQPSDVRPAPFQLSTKAICQQTDTAIMQDAFRSFPSGHSSSSFAGLGYLSLYLAGKLHVLDQRGEVWRTVLVLIPLIAASCIASSRIMDYRHHPFDVLFGSALGVLCAWGAYRQYFPSLGHVAMKGRAYRIREWGVPLSKYDDSYGSTYTRGATGTISARHGVAEELPFHNQYDTQLDEEHHMYGLEPLRGAVRTTNLPLSPGLETGTPSHSPDDDDTDYDIVRSKAQATTSVSNSNSVVNHGTTTTTGGPNVFREQISRNKTLRRPPPEEDTSIITEDEEEDLGVGHRNLLGASSSS